jgi:hypothetical protein
VGHDLCWLCRVGLEVTRINSTWIWGATLYACVR